MLYMYFLIYIIDRQKNPFKDETAKERLLNKNAKTENKQRNESLRRAETRANGEGVKRRDVR